MSCCASQSATTEIKQTKKKLLFVPFVLPSEGSLLFSRPLLKVPLYSTEFTVGERSEQTKRKPSTSSSVFICRGLSETRQHRRRRSERRRKARGFRSEQCECLTGSTVPFNPVFKQPQASHRFPSSNQEAPVEDPRQSIYRLFFIITSYWFYSASVFFFFQASNKKLLMQQRNPSHAAPPFSLEASIVLFFYSSGLFRATVVFIF